MSLKFVTHKEDGTTVVGIGLEAKNLEKIKRGQPYIVRTEDLGLDIELFIFYGDTLAELIQTLREAGINLPPKDEWRGFSS